MAKKEIMITHLAYFVKCEKSFLFKDYLLRQGDTKQKRFIIPSQVISLLNNQKDILPIFLTGNINDAAIFVTMRERTGTLAGIIQDLKDASTRMLIFGEEHIIRHWEKLFLEEGIRIHRYEANNLFTRCAPPKKMCYISSQGVFPIDDVVCVN